jgi:hypothetical protein
VSANLSPRQLLFASQANDVCEPQQIGFGSLKEYEAFEKDFCAKHAGGSALVFKDSQNNMVWNPNSTYFVNEIAFLNEHGYLENFIFDGEAFICNNEGKTVQRIHPGGFVRHEPLPEAA